MIDPYKILKEAMKEVPFVKYAFGVVGIIAGVSLIKMLMPGSQDFSSFVVAFVLMIVSMVILFLLSLVKPKRTVPKPLKIAAYFLIYLILFVLSISVSSVAFKCPEYWYSNVIRPITMPYSYSSRTAMDDQLLYSNKKPTVVGIYPKDSFGPLRKDGLNAALMASATFLDAIYIDVDSLKNMKSNSINGTLALLQNALERLNVVAVVGPPVTECTAAVIDAVIRSGRKIPVFIESATSERFIQWDRLMEQTPIYRLSSGIDQRAKELGEFFNYVIGKNIRVNLLVERDQVNLPTYGSLLFDEVINTIEYENGVQRGLINPLFYNPGSMEQFLLDLKPLIYGQQKSVIFVLGLGHDFRKIVQAYYSKSGVGAKPTAAIGGWMNAYAVDQDFRQHDFYFDRIFEITDFNIDANSEIDPIYSGLFTNKFGAKSPAIRDQAFSFDAGICIVKALKKFKEKIKNENNDFVVANEAFLNTFNETIRNNNDLAGITGPILFTPRGINYKMKMIFAKYGKSDLSWYGVRNYDDLF